MLAAFIAIGVLAVTSKGRSIFWPETVAVVAFAVAWLVKGRTVLKDRESPSDVTMLPTVANATMNDRD
jgi:hypothetical protein